MNLIVHSGETAGWGSRRFRCAIGRGGRRRDKHEGDGATPVGSWPMRRLLYRADRMALPRTALSISAIGETDGWCDAPLDAAYNRPVRLPYPAGAETLWHDDGVYDLIVPLGYNDAPVVPGAGSAIFLHVARGDFSPTEGCVALALGDLLTVLREAGGESQVIVDPG
jgi:L,D-peptidoglycan transpeptidase YkuD (ErfK/YbiS/YcfS/YnhG family)